MSKFTGMRCDSNPIKIETFSCLSLALWNYHGLLYIFSAFVTMDCSPRNRLRRIYYPRNLTEKECIIKNEKKYETFLKQGKLREEVMSIRVSTEHRIEKRKKKNFETRDGWSWQYDPPVVHL